jgi:hypothetical protein
MTSIAVGRGPRRRLAVVRNPVEFEVHRECATFDGLVDLEFSLDFARDSDSAVSIGNAFFPFQLRR